MAILSTSIVCGVSGFFRWWGGEMVACLPAGLRERFGRTRQQLIIEIFETAARFTHQKGRTSRPLGEVSISDGSLGVQRDVGQVDVVRRLMRASRLRPAEVVLKVPREKVLRRLVELPLAAAENLREVLGFEMDRHTPFKADEVYFDYRMESSDADRKRIKIDLVVVPRTVADQALRLAKTWGLHPDQLSVDDERGNNNRPFNLLPPGALRRRAAFSHWFAGGLALTASALLALVLYLPLEHKQSQLAEIEARLAQVRAEAVQADELKKQIEALLERGRFVVERKRNEHSATEILDELSRLLPDHTWALKFGLRNERLTLSGYSAKPSALIGLLEQSDMLTEVRFSSPVTMDQKIGLERFNLTAAVSDRRAP